MNERARVRKNAARISACLLAIALCGALAVAPCHAADAGTGAHTHGGKPAAAAALPAGGNARSGAESGGNRSAPPGKGSAKDYGIGAATGQRNDGHPVGSKIRSSTSGGKNTKGKNTESIDTRISVQPRRRPGRRDARGEGKIKPPAAAGFQPRRLLAPERSGRVLRNAIGVAVGHEEVRGGRGALRGFPAAGRIRSEPASQGAGAASSLEKAASAFANKSLTRSAAGPAPTAIRWRRGVINGAAMLRPGFGPAKLGGPVRALTGINGSTLRRKY